MRNPTRALSRAGPILFGGAIGESSWGSCMTGVIGRRLGEDRAQAAFTFSFEGEAIQAWPGETIAAALMASGQVHLRDAEDGSARGVVCGIGACWECRCIVDGAANTRACMTEARPGMVVARQHGVGR